MVTRFVHEPEDIRAREPRRRGEAAQEHGLGGHRVPHVRRPLLAPVRARRGAADDWFDSPLITAASSHARVLARALRRPRAHGDRCPPSTSALFKDPVFLSGRSSAASCSRCSWLTFLLPGLHAGGARLHGDAVGPRADAAHARHDGRSRPIIGKLYNKVSPRLVVGIGVILFVDQRLPDEPLHARHGQASSRRSSSRAPASAASSSR
jgi:hypothetical protein